MFNVKKVKHDIIQWIQDWFADNGPGCKAVVGISGGKDSSVVAALCVEALGKDRVFGAMMPCGIQDDIVYAKMLIDHLDIESITVNVESPVKAIENEVQKELGQLSSQTTINLPARIRMSVLYAVSQSINGRVANTCNLSEDWVGYATRYGDGAGDFSPLSNLTVTEVKVLGYELGLPEALIEKVPADGLCKITDEENLGFTYDVLDEYIRTGNCKEPEVKARIDEMHNKNKFKLQPMPSFQLN